MRRSLRNLTFPVLTLALSLPAIVWQPRPVRAATLDASTVNQDAAVTPQVARSLSPVRAE